MENVTVKCCLKFSANLFVAAAASDSELLLLHTGHLLKMKSTFLNANKLLKKPQYCFVVGYLFCKNVNKNLLFEVF